MTKKLTINKFRTNYIIFRDYIEIHAHFYNFKINVYTFVFLNTHIFLLI